MRRYLTFLYLITLTTLLAGCSFFGRFYVVNKSNKPVYATVKFSSPIERTKMSERELVLMYADRILKIHDQTETLLTKQLDYKQIGQHTISFEVPPNSTVLVGGGLNKPISADSLFFSINGVRNEYSLQSISSKLRRTGGMFPPFHYTYIVEQ